MRKISAILVLLIPLGLVTLSGCQNLGEPQRFSDRSGPIDAERVAPFDPYVSP